MASFKRGRLSGEEISLIKSSSLSPEELSKILNRSVKSIQSVTNGGEKVNKPVEKTQSAPIDNIPDAPAELPKGYARRFFEIDDSKNPGKKRTGMAIMTEAGSEAGDDFNKARDDGLLPMSSKHNNCIAKAQG